MVSSLNYYEIKNKKHIKTSHNAIIDGNFPSFENLKELAIFKFNRLLTVLMAIAVVASVITYSSVAANENSILMVHNEISDLNFENIELQNKVDNVKSFYNVNDKVSRINLLQKAADVIEVSSVEPKMTGKNAKQELNIKSVLGY